MTRGWEDKGQNFYVWVNYTVNLTTQPSVIRMLNCCLSHHPVGNKHNGCVNWGKTAVARVSANLASNVRAFVKNCCLDGLFLSSLNPSVFPIQCLHVPAFEQVILVLLNQTMSCLLASVWQLSQESKATWGSVKCRLPFSLFLFPFLFKFFTSLSHTCTHQCPVFYKKCPCLS